MNDAERVAALRDLLRETGGDLAAAVVQLAGVRDLDEFAERLSLPAGTVRQALSGSGRTSRGRRRQYPHVLRAAEPELGLPPFALDAVLTRTTR